MTTTNHTSSPTETTKIRMMLPKLIDKKEELSPSSVIRIMYDCYNMLADLKEIPRRLGIVPDSWTQFFIDTCDTPVFAKNFEADEHNTIHGADVVDRASKLLEETIEILDEHLDEEGVEYGQ